MARIGTGFARLIAGLGAPIRWARIGWAVFTLSDRIHLGLIAAGVAFFGMFALFPALAALISLFGLIADPGVVAAQLDLMAEIIPAEAFGILDAQLQRLLSARSDTLGWATVVSFMIALWSARAGMAAMMRGLNAIHGAPKRSGVRHVIVALGLTISLLAVAAVALLTVLVAPVLIGFLPLPRVAGVILDLLRWLVGLCVILGWLGLIYRFGPNRAGGARPGWITPGAILVVVLWFAASWGFSYYLANFGSYNEVYGSIGAVVAMLMWLYISAYLVLTGAALNVVIEQKRAAEGGAEGGVGGATQRAGAVPAAPPSDPPAPMDPLIPEVEDSPG